MRSFSCLRFSLIPGDSMRLLFQGAVGSGWSYSIMEQAYAVHP